MVAGAGSAYASTANSENYLEDYPTSIDSRDLNQDNVSADHGKKSQISAGPELTR